MARRIGLLTGTFDPIHFGHTELAETALGVFGLERVLIWLNAEAPHKAGVTPYDQRLAMAKLAMASKGRVQVYEGELSDQPHNIRTFLKMADSYPDAQLGYIVGADTFANVYGWDDVQSVVKHTTFILAERGSKRAGVAVQELRERLGPLGEQLKVEAFGFAGHNGASSLAVRRQLAVGERPEVIDPRVYEYIVANGLYRL